MCVIGGVCSWGVWGGMVRVVCVYGIYLGLGWGVG